MKDWKLVVIGDKKTPAYKLNQGIYMSLDEQEKYDPALRYLAFAPNAWSLHGSWHLRTPNAGCTK